jgi:hypothetical protein
LQPKRARQASVVFFLRSASAPRPVKPASIMAQVEASGTAAVTGSIVTNPFPEFAPSAPNVFVKSGAR